MVVEEPDSGTATQRSRKMLIPNVIELQGRLRENTVKASKSSGRSKC